MKLFTLLVTTLLGLHAAQAKSVDVYTDMALICQSEQFKIEGVVDWALDPKSELAEGLRMEFAITNLTVPQAKPSVDYSRISFGEERFTSLRDVFDYEYSFTAPAERLLTPGAFDITVRQQHRGAGVDTEVTLSCDYTVFKRELELKPASKKNLGQLTGEQLAAIFVDDSLSGVDTDDFDISTETALQWKHYENAAQFEDSPANLRSSYQRRYAFFENKFQYLVEDCEDNHGDDTVKEAEEQEIALCSLSVEFLLSEGEGEDRKFVAAFINMSDENGTDDYDDDNGLFYVVNWKGEVLFENDWSN